MLFAAFIAVICQLEGYRCAHTLHVERFLFETGSVTEPKRFVVVSDLHESEFGENNSDLVEKIKELEPDAILCLGDMITSSVSDEDLHIGIDLLSDLAEIAPLYMSLGNHEVVYARRNGYGVIKMIAGTGARLLECGYVDLPAGDGIIRVGGIARCVYNYQNSAKVFEESSAWAFMTKFCDTDGFKILLCHIPTDYYPLDGKSDFIDWDCDLVLSGHTHGGLWQIPGIGSPYLPKQGFFPKLDKGMKQVGNAKMIIGAGLGHEGKLFRFNDPCEIVVVDIVPKGS
ncbi:MAG: metallophosphoesterase [Clostridiales bacterium]|nr:metallophosphoesterase [Clostridiales bacterium]